MNEAAVDERLGAALEAVLVNDLQLLEYDVTERAICGRLAAYLKGVFPTYDVDVEYNRHGTDAKRLKGIPGCSDLADVLVYPDVIVHRRGHDKDNLLVVELKKSTNTTPRNCDRAKLHGFVDEYGYGFAALVDLPTGSAAGSPPKVEWIWPLELASGSSAPDVHPEESG